MPDIIEMKGVFHLFISASFSPWVNTHPAKIAMKNPPMGSIKFEARLSSISNIFFRPRL